MNYDQIVNLALSYSDRTDSDIVNRMGDFIAIVEARVNRAIRINQMATRSVIITTEGQEYYGLPCGFAGMRDIEVRGQDSDKGVTAQYLNPEQMNNTEFTGDVNSIFYTIIANQIQIYPPQSGNVLEIVYYKLILNLNETDNTNWLSERYPDCYVFGLLVEIEAFVKNPAGGELWNARFLSSLAEIEQEDQVDRWSGTPLTIKAEL